MEMEMSVAYRWRNSAEDDDKTKTGFEYVWRGFNLTHSMNRVANQD